MTNDLRDGVARAIFLSRYEKEGGKWEAVAPEHKENPWRCMADAAIAEMGGVKVKPLEWIECEDGTLHDTKCRYEIVTDDGYWRVTRGVTGGASYVADCSSLDFAKATAQDDYEDCILAAIEPAPDSVQEAALKAQIHRLTAAGDKLTAWLDDRGTADVHKWDKARDEAFRALAEGQSND